MFRNEKSPLTNTKIPLWARVLRISPEVFETHEPAKDLAMPVGAVALEGASHEQNTTPSQWLNNVRAAQRKYLQQAIEDGATVEQLPALVANGMNEGTFPRVAAIMVAKDGTADVYHIHGDVPNDALKVNASVDKNIYDVTFQDGHTLPTEPQEDDPNSFYVEHERLALFNKAEFHRVTLADLGIR